MVDNPDLTNMQRYYAQRGHDALEAFKAGRWAECDSLCTELLMIPTLPILWRAHASLLMATKRDNTAIEFAKDALKYYDILLEEKPTDAYFLQNKGEAELLIEEAEQKILKQEAGEPVSSDEDGEDTVEEEASEKPGEKDEQMSGELADDEGKIMVEQTADENTEVGDNQDDVMESVEGVVPGKEDVREEPMLPPPIEHFLSVPRPPTEDRSSRATTAMPASSSQVMDQPVEGQSSRATTAVPVGSSQVAGPAKEEEVSSDELVPLKTIDNGGSGSGSGGSSDEKGGEGSSK